MPDINRLLDPEISEAASRAVRPREFDVIAAWGHRRRRVVRARSLAGVALVTAGVVGGIQLTSDVQRTAPPSAVTAPTTAPDDDRLTPEMIVTSRHAELIGLAVSATDADVRASAWSVCVQSCEEQQMALVVTDDGFDTATYLPLPSIVSVLELVAIDGDRFYVATDEIGESFVVTADGAVTPVVLDPQISPVLDGETLVPTGQVAPRPYVALDPVTARAHRVPGDLPKEVQVTPDGRLTALVGDRVRWSDDAGASWSDFVLPGGANAAAYRLLPSLEEDTIAVVEGAREFPYFPLVRIYVSTDRGNTWQIVTPELGKDRAFFSWGVVRADGSLVTYMEGWSDGQRGEDSAHSNGPYVSAGDDWSQLVLQEPGLSPGVVDVELIEVKEGEPATLYVEAWLGGVFASTDGGATWEPTPIR